jgi:hypothetical protein
LRALLTQGEDVVAEVGVRTREDLYVMKNNMVEAYDELQGYICARAYAICFSSVVAN